MATDNTAKVRCEEILRRTAEDGARNVRLFGSHARRDARADSEIDLLGEMPAGSNLPDVSRLTVDLQDLLGYRIDVVEPEGLHWYIWDKVLKEAVPLWVKIQKGEDKWATL